MITRARLKYLEQKLFGDLNVNRANFQRSLVLESDETKEEEIRGLWKLWLKAKYPRDVEKFAKAIQVITEDSGFIKKALEEE